MAQKTPETLNTGRPAILIVDDEEVVRNAFQLYFETVGYRVTVASGGEKALEILRERPGELDVILLDLVMPGMHGIDVLRRVKEIDGSVEVIIATGCGSMTSAIEALRHGAYDYVTKPVINLEEDLLTVVRSALASKNEKVGERAIQKMAAQSHSHDSTATEENQLYNAIEALIPEAVLAELGHRDAARSALGELFSSHLDATAVLAVARGKEGKLSCLARWGKFARMPEGPLLDMGALIWQRLLSCPTSWIQLEAGSIDLHAPAPESFDALLVPLLLPPEKMHEVGAEDGAALIVLRVPKSTAGAAPPGTSILGFVAGRILAAVQESCLAGESR